MAFLNTNINNIIDILILEKIGIHNAQQLYKILKN